VYRLAVASDAAFSYSRRMVLQRTVNLRPSDDVDHRCTGDVLTLVWNLERGRAVASWIVCRVEERGGLVEANIRKDSTGRARVRASRDDRSPTPIGILSNGNGHRIKALSVRRIADAAPVTECRVLGDDEQTPLAVAAVLPVSFLGILVGGIGAFLFAVTNAWSDAVSALCIAISCGFTFTWHVQRYGYHPASDSRKENQ